VHRVGADCSQVHAHGRFGGGTCFFCFHGGHIKTFSRFVWVSNLVFDMGEGDLD